jgi:hypothetical protein
MHVTPRKGRDANMILGKGAEKEKEQAAKMGQSTTQARKEGDPKLDLSVYYGMYYPTYTSMTIHS